jgi:hypothetical protein
MNDDIRARIGELVFELRICGCYCRERETTYPPYVCTRHRLLAELPDVGIPDHLLTIAKRNPDYRRG